MSVLRFSGFAKKVTYKKTCLFGWKRLPEKPKVLRQFFCFQKCFYIFVTFFRPCKSIRTSEQKSDIKKFNLKELYSTAVLSFSFVFNFVGFFFLLFFSQSYICFGRHFFSGIEKHFSTAKLFSQLEKTSIYPIWITRSIVWLLLLILWDV